jgi:hypothetical protein
MKYLKKSSISESFKNNDYWLRSDIDEMRSLIMKRGGNSENQSDWYDKFSNSEVKIIEDLVKNYKINYKRGPIVKLGKSGVDIYINGLSKLLHIFKGKDSYFYIWYTAYTYRMNSNYYICDDIEGVIKLLVDVIFKNRKKQDFDVEQLRSNILNTIKKMGKDDLLKIKSLFK